MRYYGKGLTKTDVDHMSVDEVEDESRRIFNQLTKEQEAHKEHQARLRGSR